MSCQISDIGIAAIEGVGDLHIDRQRFFAESLVMDVFAFVFKDELFSILRECFIRLRVFDLAEITDIFDRICFLRAEYDFDFRLIDIAIGIG